MLHEKVGKHDTRDFNETKLESTIDDSMVTLNDFTLLRCDKNRHGVGIATTRETIDFKRRKDLQPGSLEILCIEVKPKFSKPFLVLAWYRPPKYEHKTLNDLEILLKTTENENKEIILIGYVNCNGLHIEDRNKMIDHLRGLYRQFQVKQLRKLSTRSALTSQTLIDHFACK